MQALFTCKSEDQMQSYPQGFLWRQWVRCFRKSSLGTFRPHAGEGVEVVPKKRTWTIHLILRRKIGPFFGGSPPLERTLKRSMPSPRISIPARDELEEGGSASYEGEEGSKYHNRFPSYAWVGVNFRIRFQQMATNGWCPLDLPPSSWSVVLSIPLLFKLLLKYTFLYSLNKGRMLTINLSNLVHFFYPLILIDPALFSIIDSRTWHPQIFERCRNTGFS